MKDNWNKTTRHFGDTFEGEVLRFKFEYKGNLTIKSVSKSCGCINLDFTETTINVAWKPRDIPTHIINQNRNFYENNKSLFVTFTDGSSTRLYLKSIVYEK